MTDAPRFIMIHLSTGDASPGDEAFINLNNIAICLRTTDANKKTYPKSEASLGTTFGAVYAVDESVAQVFSAIRGDA